MGQRRSARRSATARQSGGIGTFRLVEPRSDPGGCRQVLRQQGLGDANLPGTSGPISGGAALGTTDAGRIGSISERNPAEESSLIADAVQSSAPVDRDVDGNPRKYIGDELIVDVPGFQEVIGTPAIDGNAHGNCVLGFRIVVVGLV